MNFRRCLFVSLALVAAVLIRPAAGQEPVANAPEGAPPPDSLNAPVEASPAPSIPPTSSDAMAAAIEKIKRQATDAEQLTDETRAEIIELCDKAIVHLGEAETLAATTALLQKELDEAGTPVEALPGSAAIADLEPISICELSADEMRAKLSAADQTASAARERAQKVAAEIERRAQRRKVLPEELAKCREQLSKAEETLKSKASEQTPLLSEARRLYQTARREFLTKELQSLEQETRTYEATSRLWLARRDAAEKQLQLAIDAHKAIQNLAAEAQREDAERQAREAHRAAVNAHPAVKEAAAKNAELADRNQGLVRRTQQIQTRLAEARELGQSMQNRLADVTKRATAAKNTPAIGVMLRSQQDQMVALGPYRDRLRNRPVESSQLGLDIYEWESLRRETLHVDKAVELAIEEIDAAADDPMREDVAVELRRVLEARAGILAELISNANDCLSRLEELDAAETQVVATTEQLEAFVAEHVLWVRSAPVVSLAEFNYVATIWSDFEGRFGEGKELAASLLSDARRRPVWWGVAAVLFTTLVCGRRRAQRSCAELAMRR